MSIRLPLEDRDPRPLRILYLDLNAYFASVQQAENPELRGIPVAVVPVVADTSFLIAASYEAKAFGCKTGMRIGDAKKLCPHIKLVTGGHGIYTDYHHRVLEAVETVLPVEQVYSIDEMQIRLMGEECKKENAMVLAREIKDAIHRHVSEVIHCSIGIAPNGFLAKLGTDLQKPDGLTVIEAHELPDRLKGLSLTEFTGINRRMAARLQAKGIFTSDDLVGQSKEALRAAFGSVWGERWWYLLRGYEIASSHKENQSIGHSHVLAPELRNSTDAREILQRLLQKAAKRLRAQNLYATHLSIAVSGTKKGWEAHSHVEPTQDSVGLNLAAMAMWETADFSGPMKVSVTLSGLRPPDQVTRSLFDQESPDRQRLNVSVDKLNEKFGRNTIYLAGMHHATDKAEDRIAFRKTTLTDGAAKPKTRPKTRFRRD